MNDNFKATKAEFEEWAKEFPSLLEPKATNRKIKECVITIFLENEDSQKFNLWLNDCFHELNEYYALDAINSGIVYRFPNLYTNGLKDTSAVISPLYDNQSRMGKPIFIKWIELGARLELGIRLKVMITFPFDPRIRNPLLSILYCLYNDFTDSRAAIFEALQGVKNTFQLDDSILPSPAPTVDAVGTESKSPKDKAGTAQVISERTEKLNRLSVMWAQYNQTDRISKGDDMKWFIETYAAQIGIYVTVDEFKRHLPKARKVQVIDYDKKARRYIPKNSQLKKNS